MLVDALLIITAVGLGALALSCGAVGVAMLTDRDVRPWDIRREHDLPDAR
jgi:hypothetical protein